MISFSLGKSIDLISEQSCELDWCIGNNCLVIRGCESNSMDSEVMRGDDTYFNVLVGDVTLNGYVISLSSSGSHFSHPHTARV